MSREELIQLITENIYPNGNNEITANVLNPVLDAMVNQINDITGDLDDLASTDTSNLVNAINSVIQQFQDIDSDSVKLHSGIENPNDVPPANYNTADFYIQEDINGDPLYLWQFNGIRWNKQNTEDDRFVTYGEITKVGNEINVSTGYSWIIDDVLNSNNASQDFIIEDAETGQSRVDIIVTSGDGFELIQGQESAGEGSALQPETPIGSLLLTSINIYEDNISDPAPVGSDYITKKSFGWTTKNITGSNTFLTITDFTNAYNIVNNALVSIDGVQTTGLPNTLEYDGQLIWIKNGSTTPFDLNANIDDFNLMPFKFPTAGNFTMAVGSVACFKRFSNTMELISYNISGLSSVPTLDQVAVASSNNMTQFIKQILSNPSLYGFDTNGNIRGGDLVAIANVQVPSDNIHGINFGGTTAIVRQDANTLGLSLKLAYKAGVSSGFTGRELIDYTFYTAGLALKANDADTVHKSISGWEQGTGILSTDLNAIELSCIRRFTDSTANRPFDFGTVQTFRFAPDECAQIAFNIVGGNIASRKQQSGTWSSWVFLAITDNVVLKSGGNMTGLLGLAKYTTGTEPAYEQGAMYFNTSINKIKVGGASGWEVYNAIETARSINATISSPSATYQNNALIGATNISMVVLNGDITQGPFTFNSTTGTITMAVMATDLITVYFNKN